LRWIVDFVAIHRLFPRIPDLMTDRHRSLKTVPTEVASRVPTPSDLFGPLFERVQLEKVFADG
jgi:hypothetical protein